MPLPSQYVWHLLAFDLLLGCPGLAVANWVWDWMVAVSLPGVPAYCTQKLEVLRNRPSLVYVLQHNEKSREMILALYCLVFPVVWGWYCVAVNGFTCNYFQIAWKISDTNCGPRSNKTSNGIPKFDTQSLMKVVAIMFTALFVVRWLLWALRTFLSLPRIKLEFVAGFRLFQGPEKFDCSKL